MRYRALSSTGDYTFGQGSANFLVNSPATVAQYILTRMNLIQGTWFLDVTVGMPWFSQVIGRNTQSLYDSAIKQYILDTEGVLSIGTYSSSYDPLHRILTVVVLNVQTIFGEIANLTFTLPGLSGYGVGGYGGPNQYGA